jgi:hypothetical protein
VSVCYLCKMEDNAVVYVGIGCPGAIPIYAHQDCYDKAMGRAGPWPERRKHAGLSVIQAAKLLNMTARRQREKKRPRWPPATRARRSRSDRAPGHRGDPRATCGGDNLAVEGGCN